MTANELNDVLDVMEAAADGASAARPGLITVQTDTRIDDLSAVRATCSALHDGLRHRNIQIHIASNADTRV